MILRTELPRKAFQDGLLLVAIISISLFWLVSRQQPLLLMLLGCFSIILAFIRPAWSFVLLACIAPFEKPVEYPVVGTVFTTEMLLVTVVPGWCWNLISQKAWQKPIVPVLKWTLPFMVVLCLSLASQFSVITVKGVIRWIEFFLVLIFLVYLVRRGRDSLWIFRSLLLIAVSCSVYGLVQVFQGPASWPGLLTSQTFLGTSVRASAEYGPNTLASLVLLVIPFSMILVLSHPSGWMRMTGLIVTTVLVAGLAATFSMIGYAAFAIIMVIWLVLSIRKGWGLPIRLAIAGLSLVTVILFFWPQLINSAFFSTKLASLHNRLDYATVVGQMLMQTPWLGVGPGMYKHVAPFFRQEHMNIIGLITHPHALWLSLLAECGILGLAAFLAFIIRVILFLNKQFKKVVPIWPGPVGSAMAMGLLGFAMVSISEHTLIHDRGIHAALALGACLVWFKRPEKIKNQESNRVFDQAWQMTQPITDWAKVLEERQQGREALYFLLEEALRNKKQAKILELGCGPALDAIRLAKNKQYEVHAADSSTEALKLAAEASRDLKQLLFLHKSDVRNTGLQSHSFDLIYSQGLLEHFRDPEPVWQETVRLLKQDGFVVIDVPQTFHPYTVIKWLHRLKGTWPWGWETQYSLGQLKREAAKHGLHLIASKGYGYRGGLLDWTMGLKRWIGKAYPDLWKQWEDQKGAYWMMNVVVLLAKNDLK